MSISTVISSIAQFLISLVRNHKLKLITVMVSAVAFFVILFPFNDLADVITQVIYNKSNKSIFLQFDSIGLKMFPTPGVQLREVHLQSPGIPSMQFTAMGLSPNISSLLKFRSGLIFNAEGFLDGMIKVSMSEGKKIEKRRKWNLDLEFSEIQLKALRKLAELPLPLMGQLEGQLDFEVDLEFTDQPEGSFEFNIENFILPKYSIKSNSFPLDIPRLTFSEIRVQGHMENGSLFIDSILLGDEKDPVYGQMKGSFGVMFQATSSGFTPRFKNYSVDIELNLSPKAPKSLDTLLGLVNASKSSNLTGGNRWGLKIAGSSFMAIPNIKGSSRF